MSKKVVCLGELLLRLSPINYQRFVQTTQFNAIYGGAEANVAISLQGFGISSSFVSRVPDNAIGQAAINHLQRYGVDTTNIQRGGERLGLYYLEEGASVRSSKVIYDRKYSSISEARVVDFDFESIFKGASWFHISGITPALSKNAVEVSKLALQEAKDRDIPTSLDLNYRKSLWPRNEAKAVLSEFCKNVDVLIGAGATNILGINMEKPLLSKGKLNLEGYKELFHKLYDTYGFKLLASTLRETLSASNNCLGAMVYDGNEFYQTPSVEFQIVDRVGGGDAFAAGIIYSLLKQKTLKETAEFSWAASILKHSIPGDQNLSTPEEVYNLIETGGHSARVQR